MHVALPKVYGTMRVSDNSPKFFYFCICPLGARLYGLTLFPRRGTVFAKK